MLIRDNEKIMIPIHDLLDKSSFINKLPKIPASIGDKASIVSVFLVPITFNDYK